MLSHYDFWTKVQPSNSLGHCYGHTEVMMMADRPSESCVGGWQSWRRLKTLVRFITFYVVNSINA